MFKKIILPLVLLIFTQNESYGMETIDESQNIWETINNYVNRDESDDKTKYYPKLWWLWAFLDNVPFQYGGSKIWKHGEAYYGLSNGIGFFPSVLNFRWIKIGFVDAHINVINLILGYFKNFIQCKKQEEEDNGLYDFLLFPIMLYSCFNIHIFSVRIPNCIKIKLVAPLTLLFASNDKIYFVYYGKESTAWYITYNKNDQISWWYALLSPRIEINISEIIKYFNGK